MSSTGASAEDPATAPATEEHRDEDTVVARHAPRYPRFIVLGIVVFVVAAAVVTFAYPQQPGESRTAVFGYMALVAIAFGAAVGALVAFLADWITRRRGRTVAAEHIAAAPEPDEVIEMTASRARGEGARDAAAPDALETASAPDADAPDADASSADARRAGEGPAAQR